MQRKKKKKERKTRANTQHAHKNTFAYFKSSCADCAYNKYMYMFYVWCFCVLYIYNTYNIAIGLSGLPFIYKTHTIYAE